MDGEVSVYNNVNIADPALWMEHRMRLFEDITLPSVMKQTEKNFVWLLSFDQATPKEIIKKYSDLPNVHIIYKYPRTYLRDQLGKEIFSGDWIITSRLDNDDYIYPKFIERVQDQFDETFKLVDTDGRQLDLETGKLYTVERKTCNSPFLSLIEKVGEPWMSVSKDPKEKKMIKEPVKTVYYCSHSNMEWHFPAVKINEVLYRMVIHDWNQGNRIVGFEVFP